MPPRFIPAELRERAGRNLERFHLDPGSWYRESERLPHLPEIAGAVWNERRIQVRYRRWRAPDDVVRVLDSHGLVLKAGTWYLVARSGKQLRTYRVSEIHDLTVLDEPFVRQADFDLAAYWNEYLSDINARLYQGEATIRLSAEGHAWMRKVTDATVVKAIDSSASQPDADGWITAVVPIESVGHAHTEFLKYGAELDVLQPRELRSLFISDSRALSKLYGSRSPRP